MVKIKASEISQIPAKPFLKWAGGKGQLLEQIISFLPQDLSTDNLKRYVEPFVGSGAVFIYLAQSFKFDEIIIGDINEELIIAYKTIQKNVGQLIYVLLNLQKEYLSLEYNERKKYYYKVREIYNFKKKSINFREYNEHWIERTAQLIFLNRTCFNGLFRVNAKGQFNVPIGQYKNPIICHTENLRAIAKLLQNTIIYHGHYTQCETWVDSQTFVYFDPPYRPLSQTANFTSYSQYEFDDSEQLKLRDFFNLLDDRKSKLMLSNSDPKNENPDDRFFENAYQKYRIERVKANRSINSNALKRGPIAELLIMNY
jgi:DNA adenine methylase